MPNKKDEIYKYQPLWGSWYIDLPIGEGSFGSVYKISREDMGKKYTSAVKLITIPSKAQRKEAEASLGNDESTLSLYFEDIVKNIANEVDMLYALSGNTNILNYQDHEVVKKDKEVGWDILIRMEYVKSLRDYLKEHVMTKEEVIRLGIDICSALETCSKKGIVHRDIKDENIFVNEDGIFKLGDFGIARELSKSGRAASMRGTPLYMAPEIFRGDKYDLAVDIYSLGIVMYKLLNNNHMPFMPPYPERVKYSDIEDALEKRMNGERLPVPANAGEMLGEIVLKACAHSAEDRYASPSDMKKELLNLIVTMDFAELNTELGYQTKGMDSSTKDEQYSGTIGVFDDIYKPEQVEEVKKIQESVKHANNDFDKTSYTSQDNLIKDTKSSTQELNNVSNPISKVTLMYLLLMGFFSIIAIFVVFLVSYDIMDLQKIMGSFIVYSVFFLANVIGLGMSAKLLINYKILDGNKEYKKPIKVIGTLSFIVACIGLISFIYLIITW